ncbi:hypothetical protein BDN72DRAFT_845383 [Pluteus cervinus]|uniref:Uncharacterized protein n=1 Tax=Pluteus cervinus TaxID=181527 RepID=A0ACD3AKZ7_9AGAR|nr:hypothetical protein BDN72DRAFT_845383 [Pluteus cervinus]
MEQPPQIWSQPNHSTYLIDDRGVFRIGPKEGGGSLPDSDEGSYNSFDDDESVEGWDDGDFTDENHGLQELSADDRALFLESMQEYWKCIRAAELQKAQSSEGDDESELDIDLDFDEEDGMYVDDRPAKKMKLGSGSSDMEGGPSKPPIRRVNGGTSSRKRSTRKVGGKQVKSMEMDLEGWGANDLKDERGRVELTALE